MMGLKEFHKVDLETGIILDVCLFDVGKDVIPADYKAGWNDRIFYNPVYDFELDDWVDTKPYADILMEYKVEKDKELNVACQKAILSGFKHTIDGKEYHFSYDTEAQINFGDSKAVLAEGFIESVVWTAMLDGQYVRLNITKPMMDALTFSVMMHKQSLISKYRDVLLVQVNEAQTVEQVEAVTWES